ncbi:hypothetical protein J7L60_05660 [Candidatus Bathyarchaeota archaeon]|nr:hypothetical protein [Candidatus Bathyarchaeota archaeon]
MFERPRFLERYWVWIVVSIIIAIAVLSSLYVWLEFTVLQSMYLKKAGLNWFAITFYHGYVFIFAALIALLTVNPLPGRSDLYEAYNAFRQLMKVRVTVPPVTPYRRPPYMRPPQITVPKITIKRTRLTWLLWQVVKWAAAFSVISMSQEIPLIGPFVTVFYMMIKGFGRWSYVPRIFTLAVRQPSAEELVTLMPTMEVQYRFLYILLLTVVGTIVARLLLKALRDFFYGKPTTWIRNIFIALTLGVFAFIFDSPYWRMDITTPYFYLICLTLLFCFTALSIIFHYGGFSMRVALATRRNLVVTMIVVGLIVILGVNSSIIAVFRFNWNNNWPMYEWVPFTSKQIRVTRWAAGIEDIITQPIEEYPKGNETKILSLVRQWDSNSALTRMRNQIGVNWMTLAASEIIYVYGREYWIAPTTVRYPTEDWISRHLIYTHASKIFAIDSHSGEFVPITEVFHLSREPLIYYGERFYETVYPNVKGYQEIENVSYRGDPDYVLSGWQRMLWFLVQGQLGFAFAPPQNSIEMLYKRDVFQRVQEILIYGLKIDPDTYLVTNNDKLYYAIQVYIDYPLHSRFAASDYMRFFAVVLVNIENGEMEGYVAGEDDGFLVSFYKQYYSSWGPPPSWLVPQLRYPEALLGSAAHNIPGQLDVDFYFHVNDPYVWRSRSDFYERPPDTEVHYILLTEDNDIYFVGIQLVEFLRSEGKNLAGMYIAHGGSRLGEIHLLTAPTAGNATSLIGPTAAVSSFQTNSEVREKLTLFGANYQFGNILLYMIGQRLYYFIPVYITPGGMGQVITKMPFIGIVDAVTREVAIGSDSLSAFYTLTGNIPAEQPAEEERLRDIYMAFVDQGYVPINVTNVNPDVAILVGNASYINSIDWVEVNSTIASFISNFVEVYGGEVYSWMSGGNAVNYGVFRVTSKGVKELYFLSIRYR